MGLLSVSSMVSCGSRAMEGAMGVRLGGWRRIMPFLFSLPPRRHELHGSAEYVAMPGSSRSSACRASSVPSSCVPPVRAAAGRTWPSAPRAWRRRRPCSPGRPWTHAVPASWLCGARSPRCPSQSGRPAVPLPTGANTPGPRRNTPPFGYPDNLQSNGCCTFN